MTIRTIKQRSDRGSIKDLAAGENYEAPTAEELRLKQLYELAESTKNQQLKDSLGFIVMPNSGDKSTFPISIYRHREYINSLSQKMTNQIERIKQELISCFDPGPINKFARKQCFKQLSSNVSILSKDILIKVAGTNSSLTPKRSFRRVK